MPTEKTNKGRPAGWGEQTKRITRLMVEQQSQPCEKVVEMLERPYGEDKKTGRLTGAGVQPGQGRTQYRHHVVEGLAPGFWEAKPRGRQKRERPYLAANNAARVAAGQAPFVLRTKAKAKAKPEAPKVEAKPAETKAKVSPKPEVKETAKAKNLARLKAIGEKVKVKNSETPHVFEAPGFDAPASITKDELSAIL